MIYSGIAYFGDSYKITHPHTHTHTHRYLLNFCHGPQLSHSSSSTSIIVGLNMTTKYLDINQRNTAGATSLGLAVSQGHSEVVWYVILQQCHNITTHTHTHTHTHTRTHTHITDYSCMTSSGQHEGSISPNTGHLR